MRQGKEGQAFGQQRGGALLKSQGTALWTAGISSSWGQSGVRQGRKDFWLWMAQAVSMLRWGHHLVVVGQDLGCAYIKGQAVA